MVLKVRNLLVALLVALCATVNHAASIPTTTNAATTRTATTTVPPPPPTTTESILTATPTEDSSTTIATNEAQQEATSVNRTENARALDLDISKYTSSDFHNKVYDLQTSPDNAKFIAPEVSRVHTTFRTSFTSQSANDYAHYENYDLTTPTASLFDAKHQELQNEIKKKLEIEESVEQIEKPLDGKDEVGDNEGKVAKHNATNLDVLKYTNVLADVDIRNKTSIHKNYVTEKGLKVSYESVYNQTGHSEPVVDNFKVHSAKSPLLNNKIENDKAINISKRGFTKIPPGNSTDRPLKTTDLQLERDRSNLIPLLETTTIQEQTLQENNIYPVLLPIPLTTSPTPTASISPESFAEGSPEPSTESTTESFTQGHVQTTMYEITENEFTTTAETAFEAQDGSEEKFYEMTETPTATTTDLETTTATLMPTKEQHRLELETTVITTTEERGTTELGTTEVSTETTTITEPSRTTLQAEIITSLPDKEQRVTTTESVTSQTTDDSLTTKVDALIVDDLTTTTTETFTETTTLLPVEEQKTNKTEDTTTENSSSETPTSTIMSTIASTIQQLMETTMKYNGINTIVKDKKHSDSDDSTAASPTNEIRKENKTEHDEDFSDEVTEADYVDFQNRKAQPVVPVAADVTPESTAKSTTQETTKEKESTEAVSVSNSTTTITTTTTQVTTTIAEVGDATEDASRAEPEGASSGTIIAIVLSTVGAICLILLAVLLFVMRRRQKRFSYGQRCTPVSLDAYSMDNVSVYNSVRRKAAMRGSKRSYGNPAFDDDTGVSHMLQFQGIVRFATNSEGIKAEFEEIPAVNAKMNELPDGCATKNRYANVIPLPESRVYLAQLEDDPTSDYINANYVTGPAGKRSYYVACQAPLHNTVNDFWRMIWEQQSKVILMLTHLFENGVEKCVDYLPPSEVVDCHRLFGDYQVTLKKREVKDKYIISSLQLKNMVTNSWREVTHLWYSGWPEKGVPEEENSIIAFLIEARSYIKLVQSMEKENGITSTSNGRGAQPDSSPVVVHCSPGTGRTGTVIACDIAIREFELMRTVNIPRIVYRIRRDRASSVQTKDQYHFIYKVINLYATKLTGGALDSI